MPSVKSLLLLPLAALARLSAGYITHVTAPAEAVAAGANVRATLTAAIYIQNWDDFGIVWGLRPAGTPSCGSVVCVGRRIAYTPLYPDHVPQPGSFDIDVLIPPETAPGEYDLVAAIPYLVGASGVTAIQTYNVSVRVEAP
ncbi:hypothetical protein GGS23DRAFT_166258 [Durotheca rogersii]|uniref:uncharacterized protein n=1 Tax=Durotheca rogersii TaxID=419775 RepID=UPI0022204567|nr:uncharacterized protein GGS23DRAFT_166258 [Durotheca rogersii]KAI5867213.1 hypothetical protein GGS23DRAFT_166258 [Durotheca rogersii]